MKNPETWTPSKYILKNGKLIASKNTKEIGVASRLAATIAAEVYQRNIKQYARGDLLDLGCGKSPLYQLYNNYALSSISADWGKTLHSNNNIDVECDLTNRLPFKSETFDTIILSDVLEHIPNPESLLIEIHRILKKNGTLILNTPFFYCIHEDPHDYYRYTKFSLQRFMEISNLKIVKIEATGGSPEILGDFLAKHFQHIPLIGKFSAILVQQILLIFRKTRIGKLISKKTAERFPFGYFVVAQR